MGCATVRGIVSQKKIRFTQDGFDLDLTYITDNIIAMGYPSEGLEASFRNPMGEVQRFFQARHPDHVRVYNLCSEREYNPEAFGSGAVERFPFPDHNPCPIDLMRPFCLSVESFLGKHPSNVVAIHCKAGKGRTGMLISSYLLHCGRCQTSEEALRFFGNHRTLNGKGVTIPSQKKIC